MSITYAWNYDPDAEREAAAEERAWAEAEAEDNAEREYHAAMNNYGLDDSYWESRAEEMMEMTLLGE